MFNIKELVAFLLALYLIFFSLIVLTVEISGFVGLLSSPWFFLFIQGLEFIAAFIFWLRKGKPDLFKVIPSIKWIEIKRYNPATIGFIILVFLTYGVLVWLIVTIPPNNADSMHTHLARVMYWLQQGSLKHINSYSVFAQIYPFDAQLPILWTILLTQTDKFVGFIQFFAGITTATAIYAICRLMNGTVKNSLLIGLLFLTFPLIVFESTSTQFDLVVTAFFTISIFFFFRFYNTNKVINLLFSGLALGLSIGTKETIFMMFPGYLFMALWMFNRNKKVWKKIFLWVTFTIASFLIMGSYPYFNNFIQFKNPFGPTEHVMQDSQGRFNISEKFRFVPARFIYQFISFDALPVQMAEKGSEYKNYLFGFLDLKLNLQMESLRAVKEEEEPFLFSTRPTYNENQSWFGFASVLLLTPALFFGIIKGVREKNFVSLSLVIYTIGFFFIEIILRPGWDPYQGRYFILSTAAAMPLCIYLFTEKIPSKIYITVTCLIALLTMITAVLSNEQKPILGRMVVENRFKELEYTISQGNFIDKGIKKISLKTLSYLSYNLPFYKPFYKYNEVELRTFSSRHVHEEIVWVVEDLVPPNARMGVILGGGSFDYVFFGPTLQRQLVNINPPNMLNNTDWLDNQKLSFVLIYEVDRVTSIPPNLVPVFSNEKWQLFKVTP